MRKAIVLAALMVSLTMLPIVSSSDGDGDGVPDSSDICPFAHGSANSSLGNGCPDSDGDGLADFEQAVVSDWSESGQFYIEKYNMDPNVNAVSWAVNNSYFYAGSDNNDVRIYDSNGFDNGLIRTMPGSVLDIEVSPDGANLAVASRNGGCMILNSTDGSLVEDLWEDYGTQGVFEVAWSNDGTRVYCGGQDSALTTFYTSNWTEETNMSGLGGWVSGIDTTPDDRLIFVTANTDVLGFWTSNYSTYYIMDNHSGYVRVLAISPDGRYLATGSQDNFVIVTDIETKQVIAELDLGGQVHDIDFSSDGGTMLVARGYGDSFYVFKTGTWALLHEVSGFGDRDNNRGIWSAEFNDDADTIAIGWRRGWVSTQKLGDLFIRVQGEYYTSLMESPWKSAYPSVTHVVGVWDNTRVQTTIDLCNSKNYIGSSTNGVSPLYAGKSSNYSSTGLWDCFNTNQSILEVSYGRAPGALMIKAGSVTETCINTIGGSLSMAQVRWIMSGSSRTYLTSPGEMPALVMDSVVPNDDRDGIAEWSDLHSSCANQEIVVSHRSENRTDLTILEETVLCANCQIKDNLYPSTANRLRLDLSVDRSNVTSSVSGPAGAHVLAFTELVYSLENSDGIFIIPLVDNFTHGASDAINAGGIAVDASINASRSGDWPLQTDMRAFSSVGNLSRNVDFMKFLLSDAGKLKWEQMGFVGLDIWNTYLSYGRLGLDMYHILPDDDSDGVWDGDDLCPGTNSTLVVNVDGCPESEIDTDEDGFTNDIDDCDDLAGYSYIDKIGCPDSDGDGWEDLNDSHPDNPSEWNDTDMDGFGDNSDDCVDEFGNSTQGSIGCIDTDGDNWADESDDFPNNNTEWLDSDGDGFGNNIDVFPYEESQWMDSDDDGFGDNNSGLEGDDCVNIPGDSFKDGLFGCTDSDGDGWADTIDDLPSNPLQHIDIDGDGVGDTVSSSDFDMCPETPSNELSMVNSDGCGPSERDGDYDSFTDDIDQCPNTPLLQSTLINTTMYLDNQQTILNPFLGCAMSEIDVDGDGFTADVDWDDNNENQSSDSDGDGFGDNVEANDGDDCPFQKGTSTKDKRGCLDLDNDGWSSDRDFNDGDPTQWNDTDGDGFGDNWDNPEWSEGRTIGEFYQGATQPDRCPNEYSSFLYTNTQGCLTSLDVNDENEGNSADSKEGGDDSNIVLILGIAGTGVILTLFGAIAVILRKKPSPKSNKEIGVVHPALEPNKNSQRNSVQDDASDEVLKSVESENPNEFVSTWEELPTGDWLPNDENGVNWYQDEEGRYWHSTDDGFRVWKE